MKLWGEIPDLQVARFEFSECGRSVEWRVGCGLEALARGAPAKGYSFVERYVQRVGDWEGRGLEWARAFALVSVRWPLFPLPF